MAPQDHPAEDHRVPARPLIMRYAARSDVGRIRKKNDDSAYAGRHLAVVADGMGGHAGGDVASAATVLDMIHLDHDGYDGDATTVLADEIQTANSLLSELVHINPKLAGMGTTVTALLLADGKLHFAHIGDSRAYRLRRGVFEQVSIDHTFVQRLIDEGRLHPDEAETHPHKNVLMRVLGDVDASPELDLDELDVEPGERWLLCSDGLNYVAEHVIERTVRETKDLRECVETLVDLTLEAGSPDNVTVVMLDIVEETSDDVNTATVEVVPTVVTAVREEPGAAAESFGQGPAAEAPAAGASAAAAREDKVSTASLDVTTGDSGSPASPAGDFTAARAAGGTGTANDANGNADVSTDPHLGEHLSAEVLREELASRPHDLVGAAASAVETGSIPTIAGRTVARRAATVLTHKAEGIPQEQDEEVLHRPRRWVTVGTAAALLLILAIGLWLGYAWTQTRYYIGEHESKVAIFNGVSQRLGPIQLSTLESVTEIPMDSLPAFSQQRVRQTVPASDLYDAQRIVQNLKTTGVTSPEDECLPPSPRPSASAAPAAPTSGAPTQLPPTSSSTPGSPTDAPSCAGAQ